MELLENGTPAFQKFNKIEQFKRMNVLVTTKINGTNSAIYVYKDAKTGELDLKTASRTRFIIPEDDNYGFARFVQDNKQEFIESLGEGVHFGEWAGNGINSGEGLDHKELFLFDVYRYKDKTLPKNVRTVPILYHGEYSKGIIESLAEDLKKNGSKIVEGFMRPEGMVIQFSGTNHRYKYVFDAEETQWTKASGVKNPRPDVDYTPYEHLLQPLRLEKLLSKNERLTRDFPRTLKEIVESYYQDLVEEHQLEDDGKKKFLQSYFFNFVKTFMQNGEK